MKNIKIIKSENKEDIMVKIEDFEKDDDLVLLSKEIENTKLDDTIDLSEYLERTMVFNINNFTSKTN